MWPFKLRCSVIESELLKHCRNITWINLSTALIVHEGPSVFRIFHRWQAVNQQWKVLNYDKKRDSEELKNSEELTRTLLHQREPVGVDVSPSPSSLMAAAGTPALDTADGTTNTTAVTQDPTGTDTHADGPALPDQHCPYNFLNLLSHLRPHEPRSPPSHISTNTTKPREVVMRVTTVWGHACPLEALRWDTWNAFQHR